MANYTSSTSAIRYRDPATITTVSPSHYVHPRDRPYGHGHGNGYSRPIHVIDSSDSSTDDILNNTLTQRVLPALLSRSDRDGRPLKVVMNYGNLYLEDSALDDGYTYSSGYRSSGYGSKDEPNTVIYNAPGSTMAITSSSGGGSGGMGSNLLRRPNSPLIRTVSPSDGLLSLPYYDTGTGRRHYRARSHSRDRYGGHGYGSGQRRISYYDSSPPSPTYSSLSTITSGSTSPITGGAGGGYGGTGGGTGGGIIDRRPMRMCVGCFKTQKVCSNGFCSACDFFPTSRGSGTGSSYEKEVYIERPSSSSRMVTYETGTAGGKYNGGGGGGGGGGSGGGVYYDDFGSRRIRGGIMKGVGQLGGLDGYDGRSGGIRRRDSRARDDRELVFEIEERGRDKISDLDRDRFRTKERAWERMERDKLKGGRGGLGGSGGGGGGGGGGDGGLRYYTSDSEF